MEGVIMGFRENLLEKIRIDSLAYRISDSFRPSADGIVKIDRDSAAKLLEAAGLHLVKERDLELYCSEEKGEKYRIVVLDNDLPVYLSTLDDVAMRKSPTVKEMVSFRNARRILSDKDVVVSKKKDSVESIRKECIGRLDLSHTAADIDKICDDARIALGIGDSEGVLEALLLFSELTEYEKAPAILRKADMAVYVTKGKSETGETVFSSLVVYSPSYNFLKLIEDEVRPGRKDDIDMVHQVVIGKRNASKEGEDVFSHLRDEAVAKL